MCAASSVVEPPCLLMGVCPLLYLCIAMQVSPGCQSGEQEPPATLGGIKDSLLLLAPKGVFQKRDGGDVSGSRCW